MAPATKAVFPEKLSIPLLLKTASRTGRPFRQALQADIQIPDTIFQLQHQTRMAICLIIGLIGAMAPYQPGGGASARTHSWSSTGSFCVKAQAQDPAAATSAWSQCHTINIAVSTYSITASAGTHGTISPSGNVTVNEGANQSFSVTPDQGYYVSNVLVDNASVGATSLYTFNNVSQDHTITASFALNNRVPNANAGADQTKSVSDTVTLDGSGSSDADGDSLTFSWSFVSKPGGGAAQRFPAQPPPNPLMRWMPPAATLCN